MVARHTERLMLRGGRLTVKVDSAPLRQELTYQTSVLVERLNGHGPSGRAGGEDA